MLKGRAALVPCNVIFILISGSYGATILNPFYQKFNFLEAMVPLLLPFFTKIKISSQLWCHFFEPFLSKIKFSRSYGATILSHFTKQNLLAGMVPLFWTIFIKNSNFSKLWCHYFVHVYTFLQGFKRVRVQLRGFSLKSFR